MSSAVPQVPKPGLLRSIARIIDWRLVAAIGLPIWAFVLGTVVMHKPAPPTPAPIETAQQTAAVAPPAPPTKPQVVESDTIPAPREVVIRTEFRPLVLPVLVPGDPIAVVAPPVVAAPMEYKLPASEVVMPADRCMTFDTKLRFHPDLATAAEEARQSKKMLLVLHISGNFEDPGFT